MRRSTRGGPDARPTTAGRDVPAAGWRDRDDRPVTAPAVPGPDEPPFYAALGDVQGDAYRRNAFAAGTDEEVAALVGLLALGGGTRVLDVGCGDARHLRALASRGVRGTGVDASPRLVEAARRAAVRDGVRIRVELGDARRLPALLGDRAGAFDVVWSLCQGALGTDPRSDPDVVAGMAAAARPGGLVAATFFHALCAVRQLAPGDAFDPVGLVHHHVAEVRGPDDARRPFDLWTAAYTVREATRLMVDAGLEVLSVRGVEPGAYGRHAGGEVGLDDPELLVVARRPA